MLTTIRKTILSGILVIAINSTSIAQSGGILYRETESFMPGMEVSSGVLKFKTTYQGNRYREEYEESGGRFSIADVDNRRGYAAMPDLEVMLEMQPLEGLLISYPDESKLIAGYPCRKGIATGPNYAAEFYITDALHANCVPVPLMGWVEGTVLEYSETLPAKTITRTVKAELLDGIDEKLFEMPQLRLVNRSELMQVMIGKRP
jgi:hypothetical protein